MPAKALVQTRIDPEVKREAAAVLSTLGLTVSDAVRLLLTRVAREGSVPLELVRPNPTTVAAMEEARSGKLPQFDSVEALMADLNAED